ncbi:MAG: NADH-quinone oxidoreductase subunit C [Candidatus Aminicenantes bacterium]|nr:NADH-quinone oxidoreductase subunit C [Candidatus Aminicenantes bacterium]
MAEKEKFLKEMGAKVGKTIDRPGRLYFEVRNDDLHDVVRYLFRTLGCRLSTATGQETYRGLEVLYHFSLDATGQYFCPRVVMTDKANPRMNSIAPIVKGAEWIEREMAELLGIVFQGHPRPGPLLTRDHPRGLRQPLRLRRTS